MSAQTINATRNELLRAPGGLGPTVVSRWNFNILATGQEIQSYTIHFAAASSLSLDSVVLDAASGRSVVPGGGGQPLPPGFCPISGIQCSQLNPL